LANVYQALDNNHEVVPISTKWTCRAEPEQVRKQIEDVIGLDASDAILISAKTGLNVPRCSKASSSAAAPRATARRR